MKKNIKLLRAGVASGALIKRSFDAPTEAMLPRGLGAKIIVVLLVRSTKLLGGGLELDEGGGGLRPGRRTPPC